MFYNEEDVTHDFEEGKSDGVEMLSLKITLDTMLSKSAFINQLQLPVLCTECHKDMNTNTNGYFILQNTNLRDIGKAFEQHISNLIECHHTRSIECETGSFKYGKLPITLMMMMEPYSLESTNAQVIIGNEIYDLKAQISYKENNFYTTWKVDTDIYFKLDGNNSKQKIHAANPKHTIVAMYRKTNFNEENNSDSLKKFIYNEKSIKYFREKRKYNVNQDVREKTKEKQRVYNSGHKEKITEKQRVYDSEHKEKITNKQRVYNSEHKEKITEKQRLYDSGHKEEKKKYF